MWVVYVSSDDTPKNLFLGLKGSQENPLTLFCLWYRLRLWNLFPEIIMGLGELPQAYNKAVHGPYDPAVFYGKRDVPLGQVGSLNHQQHNCTICFQVKLQDVPAWFSRRNKSPVAAVQAMSRAYWRWPNDYLSFIIHWLLCSRWNHKYALPKYCGLTPAIQMAAGFSAIFYLLNYNSITSHA